MLDLVIQRFYMIKSGRDCSWPSSQTLRKYKIMMVTYHGKWKFHNLIPKQLDKINSYSINNAIIIDDHIISLVSFQKNCQ